MPSLTLRMEDASEDSALGTVSLGPLFNQTDETREFLEII